VIEHTSETNPHSRMRSLSGAILIGGAVLLGLADTSHGRATEVFASVGGLTTAVGAMLLYRYCNLTETGTDDNGPGDPGPGRESMAIATIGTLGERITKSELDQAA
jgi:hypothetical protein